MTQQTSRPAPGAASTRPKPVVAILDVHPPAVRAQVEAATPPDLELRMATSTDPGALRALAADADVLVGGGAPLPAAFIEASPRLKLVQKWGIGVDKIDLEAARRRGVPVAITAGVNARAVSELTLALMLMVLRRIPEAQVNLRTKPWVEARGAARSRARQLGGKTVGLVGLGNIGRQVARRVQAFDASVWYFDVRRPTPEEERALGLTYRPLEELLAGADVVSLHVPYLPSTRGLLSRERIALLKPGAIVINTARGELIDEPALVEALRAGRLGGAGFDVFSGEPPAPDHPLLATDLPNVVTTPHVAGSAIDLIGDIAAHIFANARRVLDGEPLPEADVVVPAPSSVATR